MLRKTELAILCSIDDNEAEEYGTDVFVDSYCRRSTDTPRREHPSAEQKAMEIENGIVEIEQERDAPFASPRDLINFSPCEEEDRSGAKELVTWLEDLPGENAGESSLGEHEDGTLDCTPDEPDEFDVSGPLTKIEKELLDLIGKEGINFDLLCDRTPHPSGTVSAACTMLELKGFVEQQIGNRYVPVEKIPSTGGTKFEHNRRFAGTSRSGKPQTILPTSAKQRSRIELSQLQQQVANDFMEYVRTYHHGISRKYVQLYFVRFWYYQSREQLPEHWLSNACLRFADCLEQRVGSYSSPLRIKIPPLLTQ